MDTDATKLKYAGDEPPAWTWFVDNPPRPEPVSQQPVPAAASLDDQLPPSSEGLVKSAKAASRDDRQSPAKSLPVRRPMTALLIAYLVMGVGIGGILGVELKLRHPKDNSSIASRADAPPHRDE